MFGERKSDRLDFLAEFYYKYRKAIRAIQIYLLLAGPGILVMVADNDAGGITTYTATGAQYGYNLIWFLILLGPIGGITTYTATGAQYGYNLIWFLILLGPIAYFVQEISCRK